MARKNSTALMLLSIFWCAQATGQSLAPEVNALDQWFQQNSSSHLSLVNKVPEKEIEELLTSIKDKPKTLEDILLQSSSPQYSSFPEKATPRHSQLKDVAFALLGIPYRYGGNNPETGFDCSGFVLYVFKQLGHASLPRRSRDMASVGQPVSVSNLQMGDLVFFNTLGRRFSHVGIYLGNNQFIHAPSSGGEVRVEDINGYWKKRFNAARRITL